MRVLMISDVYFPRVNGVSTSIAVFRRELKRLGHHVTLLAPDYPAATAEEDVIRIPSRYLFLDPEDRLMRAGYLRRLTEDLRARCFDIVHIQTPFVAHWAGIRLARQLGLPRVETYHTFFEEYFHCYVPWLPRPWLRSLARLTARVQCNATDAVIAPSHPMARALRDYGITVPVEVLPTGIELGDFAHGDGDRFRAWLGVAPERPVLLYVGRVAREKNIGFLLHVVAAVRQRIGNVLLVVAGEGPASEQLQHHAAALALEPNVRFIGYLERTKELPDCYRSADLFVFASRTETQGLVLLEAMACGLPVVSTAIMGTADVVREGEGAAVAADDPQLFAERVVTLLEDSVARTRLAESATRYAAQWSVDAIAVRLVEFYGRVIGAHRQSLSPRRQASKDSKICG